MGNAQNVLSGRRTPREKVRQISDKIYDQVTHGNQTASLEQFYTAILLAFNDINKLLPGPHINPPTKEQVEKFDKDKSGHLDKEEFAEFVENFTMGLMNDISKTVAVSVAAGPALVVLGAPIMAGMTKNSSSKIPVVGKVLSKLPDSLVASAITALAMIVIQSSCRAKINK